MSGFTYSEGLTVVAIAAVLLGAAIPDLSELSRNARSAAALDQVVGMVAAARTTAVTMRTTATLCPARGDRCAARNTWHRGAILFLDHNGNGRRDAADVIVRRLPAYPGGIISWRSFGNRSYLQFNDRGYTNWQNGHFQYCPLDGNPRFARQVILNAQGRARTARDTDGDGIAEDARGRALECP